MWDSPCVPVGMNGPKVLQLHVSSRKSLKNKTTHPHHFPANRQRAQRQYSCLPHILAPTHPSIRTPPHRSPLPPSSRSSSQSPSMTFRACHTPSTRPIYPTELALTTHKIDIARSDIDDVLRAPHHHQYHPLCNSWPWERLTKLLPARGAVAIVIGPRRPGSIPVRCTDERRRLRDTEVVMVVLIRCGER